MATSNEREFPAAQLLVPTAVLFVFLAVSKLWLQATALGPNGWTVTCLTLLVTGVVLLVEGYAVGIAIEVLANRANRSAANVALLVIGAVGLVASGLMALLTLGALGYYVLVMLIAWVGHG
jgi:hypothetical protein